MEKDDVLDFDLKTRIDYTKGEISLSSYMLGYEEELGLKLNGSASSMVELVDGKTTVSKIAETVSKKFSVPLEEVVEDCLSYFQDLVDRGYLEIVKS